MKRKRKLTLTTAWARTRTDVYKRSGSNQKRRWCPSSNWDLTNKRRSLATEKFYSLLNRVRMSMKASLKTQRRMSIYRSVVTIAHLLERTTIQMIATETWKQSTTSCLKMLSSALKSSTTPTYRLTLALIAPQASSASLISQNKLLSQIVRDWETFTNSIELIMLHRDRMLKRRKRWAEVRTQQWKTKATLNGHSKGRSRRSNVTPL